MLILLLFLSLFDLASSEFILSPNSKTLTINNGLGYLEIFDINSTNLYLDIDNDRYTLILDSEYFSTYFNLNNTGTFDIYYSTDNFTFVNSNYTVQNILYTNTNTNNITFSNNLGGNDNSLTLNTISLWIVVAGILTTFTVISIILILRMYYRYEIDSFLYHIDHLHINVYSDIAISDEHLESNQVKIGQGLEIVSRTSILGGILTVVIFIISAFTITSYFYDSLSNNLQSIATFSLNNNNIIPLDQSNLDIKISFYNIFYGSCNNCNNWNFEILNLPNLKPVCTNLNNPNPYITDCMIEYHCDECAVNVGADASMALTQNGINIGYSYLEYTISTNSYDGSNIINGNVTINNIFTGFDSTILSMSIIPTSFINQYNDKFTGYLLDYQNTILGSTMNLTDYVNTNNNTQISTVLKISRNLSWYSITESVKYTNLIIFSQLIAILSGINGISVLIFNFIATKTIRTVLYKLYCCHKKEIIET